MDNQTQPTVTVTQEYLDTLQRDWISALSAQTSLQADAFNSLEGLTWNQMTPSQRVLVNNLCANGFAELKRAGNDANLVRKDPLGGFTFDQLEAIGKAAFGRGQ